MSDDSQPEHKSDIHGHTVYCDDEDIRHYLRHLDHDEAKVIFGHAKHRGRAEFEVHHDGGRYNCTMHYHNGTYMIYEEGRES